MKTFTTAFILFIFAIQTYAKWPVVINFDDSGYHEYITIDSTVFGNNTWQVGQPDKQNFTSALSEPNVIVTDTTEPYASNDVSSFYIRYETPGTPWGAWLETYISFHFRIDTDENLDFGKIAFSPDNGITWVDYSNDSIYNGYYYLSGDPVITGYSQYWEYYGIYNIPYMFGINPGDIIWYKFTFVSDQVQNGKDGWMIDNISLGDMYGGIGDNRAGIQQISAYPNPASQNIQLDFENLAPNEYKTIRCFNMYGQELFLQQINKTSTDLMLNIAGWPRGTCIAVIYDQHKAIGRCHFVIE